MAIISRYSSLSTYQARQGNTLPRKAARVSKNREYYIVEIEKPTTFDLLALQQYGSPLLYWLIADFNDYLDPDVTLQKGTKIKIPRQ